MTLIMTLTYEYIVANAVAKTKVKFIDTSEETLSKSSQFIGK